MSMSTLLFEMLSPKVKSRGLYNTHTSMRIGAFFENFTFHGIKFNSVNYKRGLPKAVRDRVVTTIYKDTRKPNKIEITRYALILNVDHNTVLVPNISSTEITRRSSTNVSVLNDEKYLVPSNVAVLVEIKFTLGSDNVNSVTGLYTDITKAEINFIIK